MSTATPAPMAARPREVTVSGMLTVFGSAVALAMLVSAMGELDSAAMQEALTQLVAGAPAELDLTLAEARTLVTYAIMVSAVLSGAALVLGFFVLRRDRQSRIALTVLGCLLLALSLAGGPIGWIVTGYVAVALGLLWTRPARAWFANPMAWDGGGTPGTAPPQQPNQQNPSEGGSSPPPGWRPPPSGWRPPPPPKR